MDTPIFKVWKYIKAFSNKRLKKPSQTIVSEDSFLEAFNKLAPLLPPQQLSNWDLEELSRIPFNEVIVDKDFMLKPFSASEYNESISSRKIKSAPGLDIQPNHQKNASRNSPHYSQDF